MATNKHGDGYLLQQANNGIYVTLYVKGAIAALLVGERRDDFLDNMKELLTEYEEAALARDIEEGNYA